MAQADLPIIQKTYDRRLGSIPQKVPKSCKA